MKNYLIIIGSLLLLGCHSNYTYRKGFEKAWNPDLGAEKQVKKKSIEHSNLVESQFSKSLKEEPILIQESKSLDIEVKKPQQKSLKSDQVSKKVQLSYKYLPKKQQVLAASQNKKLYDPLNISSWAAYNRLMEIGLYTMVIATILVALMFILKDFIALITLVDEISMLVFLGILLFVLGLLMWLIGLLIFNLT